MRAILKKIYSFLQKPFTEGFHIYLLYTVLYCLPYVIGNLLSDECSLKFVVWELLHDFIICYFTVLALYIIPQKIRNIGIVILLILLLINSFVETSCLISINSVFSSDMVSIILATNIGESREFISTYFSLKIVVIWIIIILFFVVCLINKTALNKVGRYVAKVIISIVFICALYLGFKGTKSFRLKFYDKVSSFVKFEVPPDLRPYQQFNKYNSDLNDTPEYVVMIIGESFSKYHSSLYGYEKETNPKLKELQNDSLLIVYDNAESPAINTIEAFKRIMSTYGDDLVDSLAWYKCLALPTVMSSSGYNTVWISNQSPTGVYDNVATRYSELCDTSIFVGSTVRGIHRNDLDEELLIRLSDYTFKDGDKYFIVLHLMGSHCKFSERYPVEMGIFNKEDYMKHPTAQREVRAAYDNSILYNDLIVSEIFKFFENKETLGLYFSDHGLDVYKSSPDYCGHAISSDITSMIAGKQIPFMMYTSESMQEEYSNIIYQLDSVFALGFNTGRMTETIISVFNIHERCN